MVVLPGDKQTHQLSPMASFKLFFIFSILNFATAKAQEANFFYENCSEYKFTAKSSYQVGLRTLLNSLSSKATGNAEYYNNTVTVTGSRSPFDTVYGMFMCRGDIPSQLCGECVRDATQRLSTSGECSSSIAAVMWYEECVVIYSNQSFFSRVTVAPGYRLNETSNPFDMFQQASFNRTLFETLNETADEAAKPPIGAKKFATKEASLLMFKRLYCLVQCTPDLSPRECRSCLNVLINWELPRCCAGKQGGRVLYTNCNLRFEIYPFYRSLAASAPTPTPARGKVQNYMFILYIIVIEEKKRLRRVFMMESKFPNI